MSAPRILGVDDFAFRRGQRYGTILVDLEKRQPIDLLPDREAETLTAWLRAHSGIEIISRDRAGAYADGARQGAPQAQQIADRFHLLKNIGETLERIIQRYYKEVRVAAQRVTPPPVMALSPVAPQVARVVPETASEYMRSRVERERRQRFHADRKGRYDRVKELQQQGLSVIQVAKQLGLHYDRVSRFFRADEYPAIRRGKGRSCADKFDAYLREQWAGGCRNAAQLYQAIQAQGYRGSAVTIRRHVRVWRREDGAPRSVAPPPKVTVPQPRACAWILLKDINELKPEEHRLREALLELSPAIKRGREMVIAFRDLLRERQADKLPAWMEEVKGSRLIELENFVMVMRRDEAAVRSAAESEWSNGQVEGQSATRGRVSSCCDYLCRTQPDVLPSVSYRDARRRQQRGAKLPGQCSLIFG